MFEIARPQVNQSGGLDNVISAAKGYLFGAFGGGNLCSGLFVQSTVVQASVVCPLLCPRT